MKTTRTVSVALVLLGIVFTIIVWIYAETVPHHDFEVDYEDPYICLTCHEGAVANNKSCMKLSCFLNSDSSHPIFKKFPPDGKESEFATAAEVNAAGVKLINNEITCLSCHDLVNQDELHLVIEDRQSHFCRVCHKR